MPVQLVDDTPLFLFESVLKAITSRFATLPAPLSVLIL